MKSISIFLFGIFMLLSCKNETPTPKITTSKTETSYCELYCSYYEENGIESETTWVNYGDSINSHTWLYASRMIQALNLMSKEGWEFVQAYTTPAPSNDLREPKCDLHYILKRTKIVELKK